MTGRAIGYGVQEAFNETVDATESLYEWGNSVIGGALNERGIPTQLDLRDDENGKLQFRMMTYAESQGEQGLFGQEGVEGDALEINAVSQPRTVTGGIVGGISRFTAGFPGAGKLTRLSGLKGAFMNGAIADAIVFDPNDPNIMGMLEQFDIDTGQLGEVLATDPDDPEYINRLRNVAEGAAIGGIVEAIGWGVRAARATKAGDVAAAAEFTAKQEEALRGLDEAIVDASGAAVRDATETRDLAKKVFDPLEDLASTPSIVPSFSSYLTASSPGVFPTQTGHPRHGLMRRKRTLQNCKV
ncbi:hypothetical protein SLH49_07405 [Cognatiyoonia sp. IB215446]|uniref:hypothetical protein n=1 Tax=Cognatiyoonia sp. IB215446 TaxID=3097355 RepID=UPI002A17A80F|nr:hypothetical protein [Cognatiyoonia sp. IB215446]MDX8347808.1 hypothetical protein [Cognatiyoonia sp. IB215446]